MQCVHEGHTIFQVSEQHINMSACKASIWLRSDFERMSENLSRLHAWNKRCCISCHRSSYPRMRVGGFCTTPGKVRSALDGCLPTETHAKVPASRTAFGSNKTTAVQHRRLQKRQTNINSRLTERGLCDAGWVSLCIGEGIILVGYEMFTFGWNAP